MKILVTGGAGYIGSHTCVELLQTGYEVVVVDNFDNSKPEAIHRIEELANQSISFYEADVRDEETLRGIFAKEHIDAVIHFAGTKVFRKVAPLRHLERLYSICAQYPESGERHSFTRRAVASKYRKYQFKNYNCIY